MEQFDLNKYTGLKRKIAESFDCYNRAIDSADHKGQDHVRGMFVEDFDEVIDDLHATLINILQIDAEINKYRR